MADNNEARESTHTRIARQPVGHVTRKPRRADQDELLAKDVADMIDNDSQCGRCMGGYEEATAANKRLAHDVIVVVRERVLREIESYARENVR